MTKLEKCTKIKKDTFEWENLETQQGASFLHITRRAKVFGGWVLQTLMDKPNLTTTMSTCFISDPLDKWKIATAKEAPIKDHAA